MAVKPIQLITIASGASAASVADVAPRERATAIAPATTTLASATRASCKAITPPCMARA
jgi:hypothetical protein